MSHRVTTAPARTTSIKTRFATAVVSALADCELATRRAFELRTEPPRSR